MIICLQWKALVNFISVRCNNEMKRSFICFFITNSVGILLLFIFNFNKISSVLML